MSGADNIRILVADDHPLVLEGLLSCLETFDHIEVVATAADGHDALEQAATLSPDVALLDINMPRLSGLDAIAQFRMRAPDTKVLILSMHDNKEYVSTALNKGARGYILKDVATDEIIAAIEAVYRGGSYFSSGIADQLMALSTDEPASVAGLTGRELSVLLLLAEGKSNKEVARELDISVRTVETHRKNLKKKLDIATTAGLTRYVIENGLADGAKN